MKRNFSGTVLILLGIVLVGLALGLTAKNLWEQDSADQASMTALNQLKEQLPEDSIQEASASETETIPLVTHNSEEIPDYILNPEMDMPEEEINGVDYIGYLAIPALELELPIISTTTSRYLQLAPCRFDGSAYLDDLVIGAHNYVTHFGRIDDLSYGDIIEFTDMDGNVFSYEVASFEVLQPNQVEYLCSGDWPLTLYTCTLGGQTRVTVRCEKLDEA